MMDKVKNLYEVYHLRTDFSKSTQFTDKHIVEAEDEENALKKYNNFAIKNEGFATATLKDVHELRVIR